MEHQIAEVTYEYTLHYIHLLELQGLRSDALFMHVCEHVLPDEHVMAHYELIRSSCYDMQGACQITMSGCSSVVVLMASLSINSWTKVF